MRKEDRVQVRLERHQTQKMTKIKEMTGLTASQVLRRLLEVAEVQPTNFSATLTRNVNSDTTCPDNNAAALVHRRKLYEELKAEFEGKS